MGDRSIFYYDYADWIKPNNEATGAFYTENENWWHIVDTNEDENRKAYSPTHSMWIGDETKENGEYRNNWDYSIYTSNSYELGIGGQLTFNTIMIPKVPQLLMTAEMYKFQQIMVKIGK